MANLDRNTNRLLVNGSWLIKLRWVAVAGQWITISFVTMILNISIPITPLMIVLLLTSVSNVALHAWLHQPNWANKRDDEIETWSFVLALVMVLDLASLTALLFFTGGQTNPFCFFYFVNLSLSAMLVSRNWSWALNTMSVGCFTFLLYDHVPMEGFGSTAELHTISSRGSISIVQFGIIIAFATCSSVIVYFMTRLNAELRIQESNLRRAEARQAKSERLDALGTLAAGAAHELATPLSTIAVVVKEVENQIRQHDTGDRVAEDIRLVRTELDRCRQILDRMSGRAGTVKGEQPVRLTSSDLIEEVLNGLSGSPNVVANIDKSAPNVEILAPLDGLAQAIRGLVQNGIDASDAHQAIEINVAAAADQMVIRVRDHGHGMDAKVLNRISEPFFTTKEPGQGMGLGVFLARTLIQQLDGRIEIASKVDQGTTVAIFLPLVIRPGDATIGGDATVD